ncbi:MAG: hypothetical protein P4L40_14350 [Terracidiphilus sp.]|nr:hypothetical protein [Terracidiphilus sp.]
MSACWVLAHMCVCVRACVCVLACVRACVCLTKCLPSCSCMRALPKFSPLSRQVTWLKTSAVVVSIAGVVLVSTGQEEGDDNAVTTTPMGYVWLGVSVIVYALYEVSGRVSV